MVPEKELDPLVNRLWILAKGKVQSREMEFTLECEYLVRDFIQVAVLKLHEKYPGKIPSSEEGLIESAVVKFVEDMIEEAQRLGETILDKQLFLKIREIFCPLYPLC